MGTVGFLFGSLQKTWYVWRVSVEAPEWTRDLKKKCRMGHHVSPLDLKEFTDCSLARLRPALFQAVWLGWSLSHSPSQEFSGCFHSHIAFKSVQLSWQNRVELCMVKDGTTMNHQIWWPRTWTATGPAQSYTCLERLLLKVQKCCRWSKWPKNRHNDTDQIPPAESWKLCWHLTRKWVELSKSSAKWPNQGSKVQLRTSKKVCRLLQWCEASS